VVHAHHPGVPDVIAEKLEAGGYLGLNDPEGFMLAILHIVDKWKLPRSYTCISSGRIYFDTVGT